MGFSACGSEGQKKVCGGDSGGWLQGSMWCSIVGERFAELLGCVLACSFGALGDDESRLDAKPAAVQLGLLHSPCLACEGSGCEGVRKSFFGFATSERAKYTLALLSDGPVWRSSGCHTVRIPGGGLLSLVFFRSGFGRCGSRLPMRLG